MKKILSLLVSIVLTASLVIVAPVANAFSGGQFMAGRITDDSIFFNTNTMGVSDIQNFLNSQVPVCDTNGTQMYDGMTRAAYSASKGYSTPFICLKSYTADVGIQPADSYCSGLSAASSVLSAQIIYDVAQSCGVNPEVLLVLLQKEQALVTDDWPWPIQYQAATGYGCPDSSSCDPTYAGLVNQLYFAARQFKKYEANPNSFTFAAGRVSQVLYNPNTACGSSSVQMLTNATADLYNYTPYQPDGAALNNLYGNGDACSSYGNRNFWRYFNDWFGPTTSDSDENTLNFIRLNHASGSTELVGYSSISSYSVLSRYDLTGYPAVPIDHAVFPLFTPQGNLSFIRLNHSSGHVEVVTYSASSGYKTLIDYELAGYPAVTPDGSVIPLFSPNGNLNFIRLNHSSGHAEIVSYSASSGYKTLVDYELSSYPAVTPDGSVIPLFSPNGNLNFIRLNHSSGHAEIVSYSASSGYKTLVDHEFSSYPAVIPDGSVIPLFTPQGNLSFIRLNHSSGHVEVVTYSASSGYKTLIDYELAGYPAVTPDGSVIPLFNR